MRDSGAGLDREALDKASWIGEVIAQQLEAVAGMHRASELFGQAHDATWHAQQAIAHEVAFLVRADDDLGCRRSGQGRPAGSHGQAFVGAPITVGSIVQPNARPAARRTPSTDPDQPRPRYSCSWDSSQGCIRR